MTAEARAAAEQAARASYGRLVAFLAARTRDVAAAEDAVGDALAAALSVWPERGVPDRPEAWLYAAARRRLVDRSRHGAMVTRAADMLALAADELAAETPGDIADERLRLMLVCAHPAIDAGIRAPLMLQAVLGLDAARIASAFLVAPAAMGQRLVRAKAKIREAGLPFEVPGAEALPARLEAVMEAIYAAHGAGFDDVAGGDAAGGALAAEAIWLARLLTQLAPGDPEPMGLLALMLHCEARRPARRADGGAYVPLDRQDRARWLRPMVDEAEAWLRSAAALGRPGRFQCEAALQSLHVEGAVRGYGHARAAVALYAALIVYAPTTGARVGHAAAVARADGPAAGLALLAAIDAERYQPWWALAAHLHAELGDATAARAAYDRAIALSAEPAVRVFLAARAGALAN